MKQITLKIGENEYLLKEIPYSSFAYSGDKLPDFEYYSIPNKVNNKLMYKALNLFGKNYGAKLINK